MMKRILKNTIILAVCFFGTNDAKSQINLGVSRKNHANTKFKVSEADSLHREIDNGIYYTYYSPAYMGNKKPISTMLKVDINWDGKVVDIRFSDSADSAFVKAYFNNPKLVNIKQTYEEYAKIKAYSKVALLIPVNYQPDYSNPSRVISYQELEATTKFGNQNFIGNAIFLLPVNIKVLNKNNM